MIFFCGLGKILMDFNLQADDDYTIFWNVSYHFGVAREEWPGAMPPRGERLFSKKS